MPRQNLGRSSEEMRNLLITPAPQSEDFLVDAADWAELTALLRANGMVSRQDLARAVHRRSGFSEVTSLEKAGDAFSELADRIDSCGAGSSELSRYPFSLDSSGTLLTLKRPFRFNSNFGLLYWFLLFTSRADMSSQARTLDHTDPTKVFEQLCADVLAEFWGGKSKFAGAMVVGTAGSGARGTTQFKSKIAKLCENAGVGIGWKTGARAPGAGDAKLDVAAWRRFADKRQGGLIGFAQCKTGIHWRDHLTTLQPETYCNRFFEQRPIIAPLRVYMVPHRIVLHRWDDHTSDGGILMDRCRILQYGGHMSPAILKQCKRWLHAAYRLQKERRVTS